jgi:hypothetical protein
MYIELLDTLKLITDTLLLKQEDKRRKIEYSK